MNRAKRVRRAIAGIRKRSLSLNQALHNCGARRFSTAHFDLYCHCFLLVVFVFHHSTTCIGSAPEAAGKLLPDLLEQCLLMSGYIRFLTVGFKVFHVPPPGRLFKYETPRLLLLCHTYHQCWNIRYSNRTVCSRDSCGNIIHCNTIKSVSFYFLVMQVDSMTIFRSCWSCNSVVCEMDICHRMLCSCCHPNFWFHGCWQGE